jgi:hypothetical protein
MNTISDGGVQTESFNNEDTCSHVPDNYTIDLTGPEETY